MKTPPKSMPLDYWTALAAAENALLAFEPINRTVPTTSTRMTANITAYSAMSWPDSSDQSLRMILDIPSSCRGSRNRTVEGCNLVTYDAESDPICQIEKRKGRGNRMPVTLGRAGNLQR